VYPSDEPNFASGPQRCCALRRVVGSVLLRDDESCAFLKSARLLHSAPPFTLVGTFPEETRTSWQSSERRIRHVRLDGLICRAGPNLAASPGSAACFAALQCACTQSRGEEAYVG
jgi:hypothetical protein